MKSRTAETNPQSQAEKSLRELRSRIVAGQFPAATRLGEVQLAKSLGVSRTPLRSALLQLAQEGLLERTGSSYTVRAFSFQDALAAIELRGVIEGTAARMAAMRTLSEDELTPIKNTVSAIDHIITTETINGYCELNDVFHRQLAALSGNALIEKEVRRASQLPFAAPSAFSSSQDDIQRFRTSLLVGQQHHHALVESIARHEGSRAEYIAREHAYLARTNIEVAYREREQHKYDTPLLALITGQDAG